MTATDLRPSLRCLLAATLALVPGCGTPGRITPDPAYTHNLDEIQDIDYPASHIVGDWVQIGGGLEMTDRGMRKYEARSYIHLNPVGTGIHRTYVKYEGEKSPMILENNFHWKSTGKNRWSLVGEGGPARVVSMRPGMVYQYNPSGKVMSTVVRFHHGRLYPLDVPNTYVRLTEDAVREQARLIRGLIVR